MDTPHPALGTRGTCCWQAVTEAQDLILPAAIPSPGQTPWLTRLAGGGRLPSPRVSPRKLQARWLRAQDQRRAPSHRKEVGRTHSGMGKSWVQMVCACEAGQGGMEVPACRVAICWQTTGEL